ncbi:MAG TPA: GNAT family N-acetyltransferase [Acidimicrobiia bacterium]
MTHPRGDGLEIRIAAAGDLPEFASLREQGYAIPAGRREQWAEQMLTSGRAERLLGAYRDGHLVGMLNVLAFQQWFGARPVPMGGVASVVVAPEQRGLGIAPRLLARSLELMAERGEVISTLGPATSWVYRKCGWEHGGLYGVANVRTADLVALAEGASRERRAVAADREGIVAAYDRAAPGRPGFLARPSWRWDERLIDGPHRYVYVVERDGRIDGYVAYSQTAAVRGYTVWVDDLVAADGETERTLWRHLGAHAAQADRVTVAGVPLDALALMLPEQTIRPVGQQVWMTRIVDAPGAVARRGYPSGVRAAVEFRLVDPMVAANDGCWRLVVESGEGRLERVASSEDPDVEITINGFASLFTGWSTSAVLVGAGAATGISPGVAGDLDAIFSGRVPTMCDDF